MRRRGTVRTGWVSGAALLCVLGGCGSEVDIPGVAPWPDAPVVADVPSDVPDAESRAFEMDFGGGGSGAPYGVNFFIPSGTVATAESGVVDGAARGFTLTVPQPGDAVVCAASVRMKDRVTLTARMSVPSLTPTAEAWTGLDVEIRARDEAKQIVSPEGARFVQVQHLRAPAAGFVEWSAEVDLPVGAVQGEVCWRFVKATGQVAVDRLVVESPGVPVPLPLPIITVDWPLNEPGGAGGAPLGFAFLVPPGTTGATLSLFREPASAPEKPAAGEVGVLRGFVMDIVKPGNTLVCSDPFAVAPGMRVRGRVQVESVETDARGWTGFVAEIRTYDMVGGLASAGTTPFTLLQAWKAPGAWEDFDVPFAPPKGAANGKLCFRFVESVGVARVERAGVGE